MSEDLHHIDDLFKSGFEGKEETPSPAVWENIEKELDKKDSRPRFFYWWTSRKIAAAVLILLGSAGLFAGGYYLGVKKENEAEQKEQKRITTPVTDKENSRAQATTDQPVDQEAKSADDRLEVQVDKNPSAPTATTDPAASGNPKNADEAAGKISSEPSTPRTDTKSISAARETVVAGTQNTRSGPGKSSLQVDRQKNATPSRVRSTGDQLNKQGLDAEKNQTIASSAKPGMQTSVESGSATTRSWEPEQINAELLSREVPDPEKHITYTKTAPAPAPGLTQPAATKSIPVLNKRSSAVDLPRFSLTPVAALQFGSNRIVSTSDPHAQKVKTDIDRTESQPMSFNGGILADLKIARNMTIQSGIMFTNRTIEIEPKYIKAERNPDGKVRYKLDCSAGTYYIKKSTYARPGDSALTKFSTNELNYINIPLALTYHFGGKKFSFFATAGAGLNILTDQYLETGLKNYNYDENESIATNLKSRYYNGTIGAGINYRPFRKVSFLFSPQYQFALSPMNENMPVKAYPRIFNMQLGMQIRL